ncbi:MAG: hypothetical protein A2029_11045 [Chloroflexi bacterium RBG_19FT_COMBO_47_9]|nr:MAG: hypothetical protein A2029_11045 [Chloroflexi bacterium RBG_19FT_COMBO_47_9]
MDHEEEIPRGKTDLSILPMGFGTWQWWDRMMRWLFWINPVMMWHPDKFSFDYGSNNGMGRTMAEAATP